MKLQIVDLSLSQSFNTNMWRTETLYGIHIHPHLREPSKALVALDIATMPTMARLTYRNDVFWLMCVEAVFMSSQLWKANGFMTYISANAPRRENPSVYAGGESPSCMLSLAKWCLIDIVTLSHELMLSALRPVLGYGTWNFEKLWNQDHTSNGLTWSGQAKATSPASQISRASSSWLDFCCSCDLPALMPVTCFFFSICTKEAHLSH